MILSRITQGVAPKAIHSQDGIDAYATSGLRQRTGYPYIVATLLLLKINRKLLNNLNQSWNLGRLFFKLCNYVLMCVIRIIVKANERPLQQGDFL